MMLARIAALLVIASQLILIWVSLAPSGRSSVYFMVAGHPLAIVGVALGIVALTRRKARERRAAAALRPPF
jgi:hypothetical protein